MHKFDDLKGRTTLHLFLDFFKNIAVWGKKKKKAAHLCIFLLILAIKLVRCHKDCKFLGW